MSFLQIFSHLQHLPRQLPFPIIVSVLVFLFMVGARDAELLGPWLSLCPVHCLMDWLLPHVSFRHVFCLHVDHTLYLWMVVSHHVVIMGTRPGI